MDARWRTWRWVCAAAVFTRWPDRAAYRRKGGGHAAGPMVCAEFERASAVTPRVIASRVGRDVGAPVSTHARLPVRGRALCGALDHYVHDEDEGGDPLARAFGARWACKTALGTTRRCSSTTWLMCVCEAVDERFESVRYAEKLPLRSGPLRPLAEALAREPHLDRTAHRSSSPTRPWPRTRPTWCCLVPSRPVYAGAAHRPTDQGPAPQTTVVPGGGYVN